MEANVVSLICLKYKTAVQLHDDGTIFSGASALDRA